MIRLPLFVAALMTATSTMAMASETRHADAHEHGHGELTIAMEGTTVEMELEIPGMDIVGFEHEPETEAQHEAFNTGKAKLAKADALFNLTGEATCEFKEAKFLQHEDDDHDHDHDKKSKTADHDEEHEEHMEFHVSYLFSCDDTAKIDGLSFPFFGQFPNSEELDVQIASPKGQFQFEVSPDQATLTLD